MFKILSIDGGGIRGIIPAIILDYIYIKTGKPIYKLFNLFSGTSTGGILALGLVYPYNPEEIIKLYDNEGEEIFKPKNGFKLNKIFDSILNIGKEKYDINQLNKVMKKYFGNKKLNQSEKSVIIPSYNLTRGEPNFFKSRYAIKDKYRNFLMSDVATATAAAPTYFEPYLLRGNAYIDGGVFANNPSMCALAEGIRVDANINEIIMISIGTGDVDKKYNYEEVKDWGIIHWARPVIDIEINGQSQAADYQLRQILNKWQRNYYRFEPQIPEELSSMDDANNENIVKLKKLTYKYIEENKEMLDEVCNRILE